MWRRFCSTWTTCFRSIERWGGKQPQARHFTLNTAHATPYLASVSFPPTLPTPAYCGFTRSQRRGQHAGPTSSTTIFQASPVLRWRVYCFHHNFQLLSNYSFNSLHTARPWFRACGLRGRVWARPAGRRRRATVHAPTAFIMERTQSPVSSSRDTSDSTEPKPRLQSTFTTATTPLSMWLFMDAFRFNPTSNAILRPVVSTVDRSDRPLRP